MADNNPGPKTDKSAWKRTTLSWVGLIVALVLVVFVTVKLTVNQMPTTTTTTTSKEEAKAPTLSPKEKEDVEFKAQVKETLTKLVDWVKQQEEAKKAPSATNPQGGNALPPTGQTEGQGQQQQGGYGGQRDITQAPGDEYAGGQGALANGGRFRNRTGGGNGWGAPIVERMYHPGAKNIPNKYRCYRATNRAIPDAQGNNGWCVDNVPSR